MDPLTLIPSDLFTAAASVGGITAALILVARLVGR